MGRGVNPSSCFVMISWARFSACFGAGGSSEVDRQNRPIPYSNLRCASMCSGANPWSSQGRSQLLHVHAWVGCWCINMALGVLECGLRLDSELNLRAVWHCVWVV